MNRMGSNETAPGVEKPGPGLRTSKLVGLSTLGVDYQFWGAVQPLKEWVIYAVYMRE